MENYFPWSLSRTLLDVIDSNTNLFTKSVHKVYKVPIANDQFNYSDVFNIKQENAKHFHKFSVNLLIKFHLSWKK